MSYQRLLVRRMFEGEPVRRFMTPDPVTVSQSLSVRDLLDNYVLPLQHPMFPVVDEGRLVGSISTADMKGVPREVWSRQSVGAIARPYGPDDSISPDDDAVEALGRMSRGCRRLLVVDGGRLVGILSLQDLLRLFSLRMELEEAVAGGARAGRAATGRTRA
jgi:CBS domain-containing protein